MALIHFASRTYSVEERRAVTNAGSIFWKEPCNLSNGATVGPTACGDITISETWCWVLERFSGVPIDVYTTRLITLVNCPNCKQSWEYIEANIDRQRRTYHSL